MKLSSSLFKTILTGVLCLLCLYITGAQKKKPRPKGRTKVVLIHADEGRADKFARPDVEVLVGHVKLRHGNMFMFCDSALVYDKTNSFEAFNNVRMKQGDSLSIYGDYLYYDGIGLLAQLRGNVKMIDKKTTLLTDSLNYDRLYNLGYYFDGGTLMDADNVLTSDWGEYSPVTKMATFNHSVKLVNPKFILTSDTLKYHTRTKIATILGPSDIVSDKNHITSNKGKYNTRTQQAFLLDRSVLTNEGKVLIGDSLYYNRKKNYGEAFNNVFLKDSVNKTLLTGDYCYYNELIDSALATKKAIAVDYSQKDSAFVHADTLMLTSYNLRTDSLYRVARGFPHVRMYRKDIQGVCGNFVYSTKDSCLVMRKDPILWNEGHQLLGEEIYAYMNDSTIDWAHIVNQALTVDQKDSVHYNQISGKEMKAFFKDKEMKRVEVIGNLKMVFYPEEKDSTRIGLNYGEGSLLHLFLEKKKMKRAVMIGKSDCTMYPMDQIPPDKLKLPTFVWLDYIRPLSKNDLLEWRGKNADQSLHKTTRNSNANSKRSSAQEK